jgi:hypothetical protein
MESNKPNSNPSEDTANDTSNAAENTTTQVFVGSLLAILSFLSLIVFLA